MLDTALPRAISPTLLIALNLIAVPLTRATETTVTVSAPPDSLAVELPDLVVSDTSEPFRQISRTRLPAPQIAWQDPASLADLGGLLPSARVTVNSRGDAHAMIRGAPDRHVQPTLDGIPLNLPWDERVDLETVPAVAVGSVEGRRGIVSLLDGPGALAGSVRLLPPAPADTPRTRVRAAGGTESLGRAEVLHERPAGAWQLLGAGAWRTRDAFPLPDGGGARQNSDLTQWSALVRGARPVREMGRLSLLATGWTGEKGVPPELHLGKDARFWRYPVRERALLGAALELPLGADREWDLGATVSADFFHQEIDPRGPDQWGAPQIAGQDYEKNWDRTGYGRMRLTRWLGQRATVALQGSARYTNHRESVTVGGPVLPYAQWLTALVAETELLAGEAWTVRAGLGWDHAATPESGDKPQSPARDAPALNLRLARDLGRKTSVYAAASRRSRFPSLRESYSGALGRFVPNPDLEPERQDQVELGTALVDPRWSLEAAVFYGRLTDGIERIALEGNQYQRVNRGEILVPGLELIGAWRPLSTLEARLHHTILDARSKTEGIERPAEDRPQYLSRASVSWQPPRGAGGQLETRVVGPRWSADTTSESGLRRLPAGVTWHLRASWRWEPTVELFARADNLFDQRVDFQTGLPGPGRVISGGIEAVF